MLCAISLRNPASKGRHLNSFLLLCCCVWLDILINESTKILWNFSIQTDHTIPHNKPDIVIVDKRRNEPTIIDIAIPNDHNLAQKRLDKLHAYTDLFVEIKSLWNLTKVTIVPVIIGAMGIFYSHFKTDVEKIPFENYATLDVY